MSGQDLVDENNRLRQRIALDAVTIKELRSELYVARAHTSIVALRALLDLATWRDVEITRQLEDSTPEMHTTIRALGPKVQHAARPVVSWAFTVDLTDKKRHAGVDVELHRFAHAILKLKEQMPKCPSPPTS